MCMFMGFAGYGIGGKSRYDHDMIAEHIIIIIYTYHEHEFYMFNRL